MTRFFIPLSFPRLLLLTAIWCRALSAQSEPIPEGGPSDRNIKLQIQLDRVAIKAFEPIYLSLSAEQFVQNAEPEVSIRKGAGAWEPVIFPSGPGTVKPWTRFKGSSNGGIPRVKFGAVLLVGVAGERPRFLFSSAGEYKLRVKLGPDSTTLDLTVFPSALDDERAATILGTDLFPHLFEVPRTGDEARNDPLPKPDLKLRDAAARVVAEFPGSTIANYCQAFLYTVTFRDEAQKRHPPAPSPAFYSRLVDKLETSASTLSESFFSEELLFYSAYAHGLSLDLAGVMKVASSPHSTLTPWADSLLNMKVEVQSHLPKAIGGVVPISGPQN